MRRRCLPVVGFKQRFDAGNADRMFRGFERDKSASELFGLSQVGFLAFFKKLFKTLKLAKDTPLTLNLPSRRIQVTLKSSERLNQLLNSLPSVGAKDLGNFSVV